MKQGGPTPGPGHAGAADAPPERGGGAEARDAVGGPERAAPRRARPDGHTGRRRHAACVSTRSPSSPWPARPTPRPHVPLIADALDLVHRLPRTWAVVEAGECEPWVARKVAVITRDLLLDDVGRRGPRGRQGDRRTRTVDRVGDRPRQGHRGRPRDPPRRARAIRHQRYVSLSRADELGYRHVISRVTAGDAAWIDAMVDRVAEILPSRTGADHNHDELRSLAFGWLARPVELLKLLLEHTDLSSEPDEQPAWAPDHAADTVERFCDLPARQLGVLRSRGRLFVHVTDAALRPVRASPGSRAWARSTSPSSPRSSATADVTVTPVLDLSCGAARTPTNTPRPSRTTSGPRPVATSFPFCTAYGDPRRRRLRPPVALRRCRAARPDRTPQLGSAPPTAPPHEDPRRLHATGSPARDVSSGRPRTGSPSSSTTPARPG